MHNRIQIVINQDEQNQLAQAADAVNKVSGTRPFTGCKVEPSDHVHKDQALLYVIIFYSDNQVLFDLVKTFGIILQKVNPQPL